MGQQATEEQTSQEQPTQQPQESQAPTEQSVVQSLAEANTPQENTDAQGDPEGSQPQGKEPIRIGDKEFYSFDEAKRYAESLYHQNEILDARQQGFEEALQRSSQGQQTSQQGGQDQTKSLEDELIPDIDEDKFWEDPKGTLQNALKEAVQKTREKTRQELLDEMNQEKQRDKIWTEFYDENPDLKAVDSYVQTVLQQNWDTIGNMKDYKKAMKTLANKVRDGLQKYIDETKPKQELPNSQQGPSPGNQTTPQAPQPTQQQAIDFISQIGKLRNKKGLS